MQWDDEGIILGSRPHGETSLIVELMTREHGRHMGIVKGGRSRRLAAVMQPGNKVAAHWWARLDEHLGSFSIEPLVLNAAQLMRDVAALYGLQLAASHLRLLAERDPHPALYHILCLLIEHLDTPLLTGELLVRLELRLLEDLGFGLDLSQCAASGVEEDLIYVSPKSGRAVSRHAGEPWKDKLLAFPDFLHRAQQRAYHEQDVVDGFALTGFFLTRHVWEPRGLDIPPQRAAFIRHIHRMKDA